MIRVITLLILLGLSLFSCQTCRVISCNDAKYYEERGYVTRVAVYKLDIYGMLAGLGIWKYHAQAQVLIGDRWYWVVNNGGFSEVSTYSISNNEIYYWNYKEYEGYLRSRGLLN